MLKIKNLNDKIKLFHDLTNLDISIHSLNKNFDSPNYIFSTLKNNNLSEKCVDVILTKHKEKHSTLMIFNSSSDSSYLSYIHEATINLFFLLGPVNHLEKERMKVSADLYVQFLHNILNNKITYKKEFYPKNQNNIHPKIKKVLDYTYENYPEDIGLNQVSKLSGFTKNYFCALFKNEMKISYIDFLNKYRIEKSVTFLLHTTKPVYKVAQMVGFNNQNYFNKQFKKIHEITPQKYREKILKRKDN